MQIKDKPIWKEDVETPQFPKLSSNLKTEVVVIGAGLSGILSAYLLAKSGKKVVVLEKGKVGGGVTGFTTAFITQDVDSDLSELIKLFGEHKARLIWQSGSEAIDLIEQIVLKEKIDCEFSRVSSYKFALNDEEFNQVNKDAESAAKLGFEVSESKSDVLGFRNKGFLELRNQAKFHPLKFLFGLAERLEELEVQIYQETEVIDVDENKGIVKTDKFEVQAEHIMLATYEPFDNRFKTFLKQGMYYSFVFAVEIERGVFPEALYVGMDSPYHYFRIDRKENYDRMIIGGEDHKKWFAIDDEKNYKALDEYLKRLMNGREYRITHKWSGPILEPSDGIALIGKLNEREYEAIAFSGNGMTYSAISAMIFNDHVLGKKNLYKEVYDLRRFPNLKQLLLKAKDYTEEFFGGVGKNIFRKKTDLGRQA